MVSSSSICCNDSLHSRSASDMYSSSSAEELVGDEGRESTSSKSSLLDMAAVVVVGVFVVAGRWSRSTDGDDVGSNHARWGLAWG
jgi:hypothetical protein